MISREFERGGRGIVVEMLIAPSVLAFAIPGQVLWSYGVFAAIFAVGLAVIFFSGDWHKASGFDYLVLFGPLFYGAPVAAFGTEHFTITSVIASIVPKWMPWHYFWAYLVGACFIAAGLSLVTRIQVRLSASLLALTFFLFVVLMDVPVWARNPRDRFGLTFVLRELSFSGGPLALAASLSPKWHRLGTNVARYFIAIPVLFYSLEQFLHADHVPGIPLEPLTPAYVYGHAIWTYLAAAIYAFAGILLLVDRKTRAAASWVGLAVLLVELVVYVPFAVVERANFDGFNYLADTLMFGGTVLLLAGAMPRGNQEPSSSAVSS